MDRSSVFLCLPSEMRHRIYEMLFEDMTITIHPATVVLESTRARQMQPLSSTYTGRHNPDLAILQVCRQVHREAESVFYRVVTFHIDIMVSRPFVPTEKLYRMHRLCGGAEVGQLLEVGNHRHSLRKKHSIIGPFEPDRVGARELNLVPWVSDPVLAFMVEEANREVQHSISLDMYLSVYSHWVF